MYTAARRFNRTFKHHKPKHDTNAPSQIKQIGLHTFNSRHAKLRQTQKIEDIIQRLSQKINEAVPEINPPNIAHHSRASSGKSSSPKSSYRENLKYLALMLLSICIAFKLISDMDASLTKEDIMATIKLGHTDTTAGIPKGGRRITRRRK